MSDHIGSFFHLCCCITESSQKLKDIHIVHTIFLLLPRSGIWDVVKQNLLDKDSRLTLNAVTAELLSVSDCIQREHQLDETDQLALLAKSSSSVDNSGKSKSARKGKLRQKWRPTGMCHTCSEKGH